MPAFEDWPVVPKELRPKKLFHMSNLPGDIQQALSDGGWELVDVRLLPENTPEEKELAIKAFLQGIRLGSIMPQRGAIHFADLEARTYAMLLQKKPEPVKRGPSDDDLEGLLGDLVKRK